MSFLAIILFIKNEKQLRKGHKTEEAINTIDDDLTRLVVCQSEALSPREESEVLTNILVLHGIWADWRSRGSLDQSTVI